jgi:hypothetical protein
VFLVSSCRSVIMYPVNLRRSGLRQSGWMSTADPDSRVARAGAYPMMPKRDTPTSLRILCETRGVREE